MNLLNCSHCNKEYSYKKKAEYERHIVLCELIAMSNKKKDIEEDEDIPSVLELYKIIRELSIQNKKLCEKVNTLEKIVQRGVSVKKVDILERLNHQKSKVPLETYNEWVRDFEITEDDIENLITEQITLVICNIVSRNVKEDNIPIISSDVVIDKKKNVIYIYDLVNSNFSISPSSSPDQISHIMMPEWIKMEAVHFMRMICTIYKSLLTCLQTKWKETNHGRYLFDELYSKILKKITGDDLKDAKLSVADFADEEVKKRAFIDVLGAILAMKIFFSQKVE